MNTNLFYLHIIIFTLFLNYSYSQESANQKHSEQQVDEKEENHSESFKKHAISFIISHTQINTGIKNNKDEDAWLVLASFGLNYNFNLNKKWAIGLHSHMIIEEFAVKGDSGLNENSQVRSGGDEIVGIERGRPISVAIIGTYKIHDHIALLAGGGMEFSSHENFKVVKFGIEFPFHIPNNWEVFGAFSYDINIDAYQSFTFGLGIAKLF